MIAAIQESVRRRQITRVCHFTPERNLVHIAAGGEGILSTRQLKENERAAFTATDLLRLDRHPGHISCSIEFPNMWYFRRARDTDRVFRDWVVLLITPDVLAREGTAFCRRNAAAAAGALVEEGAEAFEAVYAPRVDGQRTWIRGGRHLPACPTDDQAEVLVPDRIPLHDILAIAIRDEEQGRKICSGLECLGLHADAFQYVVAPHFFGDPWTVSTAIRNGTRLPEHTWSPS